MLGSAARSAGASPSEQPSRSSSPKPPVETKPSRPSSPAATASSSIVRASQTEPKSPVGPSGTKRQRDIKVDSTNSEKPTAPPARRAPVIPVENLEDYTNRILTEILHATVEPDLLTLKSRPEVELVFLTNLNNELLQSNEPLKLTLNHLDSAVLEAASFFPAQKPLLHYMLPAWSRAQALKRNASRDLAPEKLAVLAEAKRICISNCMFALTMPSLYG